MSEGSGADITGGGNGAPVAIALVTCRAAFIASRNCSDCFFQSGLLPALATTCSGTCGDRDVRERFDSKGVI